MSGPIRSFFEGLLERDAEIAFFVDARHKTVIVPASVRHYEGKLLICLRHRDPHETMIDDEGVHSTLAFQGHVERCHFPWDTIWAVFDAGSNQGVSAKEPPEAPEDPWVDKPLRKVNPFRVVKGGLA